MGLVDTLLAALVGICWPGSGLVPNRGPPPPDPILLGGDRREL